MNSKRNFPQGHTLIIHPSFQYMHIQANLLASFCHLCVQVQSGIRSLQEQITSNRCIVTVRTDAEEMESLLPDLRVEGWRPDRPFSSGWRKAEIDAGEEMPG